MQASDLPVLVAVPFAESGTKNTIPTAPSPTPGLASLQLGFPPVTMIPLVAGGIPPAGADINGILNLLAQTVRWINAGGTFGYNGTFSTAIGGYPKGAVVANAAQDGFWLSTADNNTTNPDTGGAGWVPAFDYGIATLPALTNANVTLSAAQYGKRIIILPGTLTGNVQIIFPSTQQQWLIVNATTGNFTVTCKTAAGTGVVVAQGGAADVYGDGTNIDLPAQQVGAATAPTQAVQLGQVQQNYAWNHQLVVPSGTGNFIVPAGVYNLDVSIWGGGGGGGGVGSTGGLGGGGGGGGGSSRGVLSVTPGQSIAYATGAAGAGGAAGGGGGTGGTTSFGALSATGGLGGANNGTGNGGTGGTGTGGVVNTTGAAGSASSTALGGAGGGAPFGGPGGGAGVGGSSAGSSPGGGGAGRGPQSTGSGSNGGNGLVQISY